MKRVVEELSHAGVRRLFSKPRRINLKLVLPFAMRAALALALAASVHAQSADPDAEYVRSHFAKFEYQIPMRDGVKLFTAVYVPYDRAQKYPILLFRTPY